MIEVILSPDLALQDKREQAQQQRLQAVPNFQLGQLVKAGKDGKAGVLESISPSGFVSIRWDCGSLLSGVEMNTLVHATL